MVFLAGMPFQKSPAARVNLPAVLTLLILAAAVALFISERLRVDLVALLVLGALTALGLVTPTEALAGFSNPAVVTVWAVFILGGGLSRTGVASLVGRRIVQLAGSGETRLLIIIMLVAAGFSAFMNTVGVVALLLPVVVDIARRTGRAPSRLLMPLSFAALLGGTLTLIGTPPNILVSQALQTAGQPGFQFFDFAPVGIPVTLAGILFMASAGRRLLPSRDLSQEMKEADKGGVRAIEEHFAIGERLSTMRVPLGSPLAGATIGDSKLGSALGLTVLRLDRKPNLRFIPNPGTRLEEGDLLTVSGRLDALHRLKGRHYLEIERSSLTLHDLTNGQIAMAEISLAPRAPHLGKTLQELNFRNVFGVIVLAMWRNGKALRAGFDNLPLEVGDALLIQGERERLEELHQNPDFLFSAGDPSGVYGLDSQLLVARIPADSPLGGTPLAESRLAEAAGLAVLGIVRDGVTRLMIQPREILQPGDLLLVKGNAQENLRALEALQGLEVVETHTPSLGDLETEKASLTEVALSPYAAIFGKTLRQIQFRKRYNLNVLAIFRQGRSIRTGLANIPLQLGDALLLHGERDQLRLLNQAHDFIVLSDIIQPAPRVRRAALAVLIMLGVITTALLGWLPIAVAGVIGASLMVLGGCLTMDEAYREIEWRAVFLIAGMLPIGTAMEHSGVTQLLADTVIRVMGNFGDTGLIAGLFLLTVAAVQIMPNAIVVVLMAPVSLAAAAGLGISPHAAMMVVAVAASTSFLSPVGHPANVLIMGPGGYRVRDYARAGLPLTLVVLLVTLLVLPLVWRL
jgi:di/tricarboxylate transporter